MDYSNIINIIEEIAPLSVAASWDRSGLQVASTRENIFCLAVCLDPTPKSLQSALDSGADMILSHHPLTLEACFPDRLNNYHYALSLLLSANIPLYTAHTSLDANLYGPASWLAEALDLCECNVLDPICLNEEISTQYGFGRIGCFSSPVSVDAFQQRLEPWLGCSIPRLVGELPSQIYQIAFCPGAGSTYAVQAAQKNADVFITGDVRYHQALEFPLPVLDVGHFCLEEEMMRRLAEHLQSVLSGVTVIFISSQDPLRPFLYNT